MAARPGTLSWRSFSGLGVFLGALLFAASLTPSLIPRPAPVQGVLGGAAFASGYGIGVLILWLWQYLELPMAENRIRRIATWIAVAVALVIVVPSSWHAAEWQNTIRVRMDMPTVDTAHPFQLGLIAVVVALALILLGRLFFGTLRLAARHLERFTPTRLARFLGLVVALTLFALVIDGVLFRGFLIVADRGFQARDALMRPETAWPEDPAKTGSAASLVRWDDLGSAGRDFVTNGPSGAEISAFLGRPALDPIRVFVGLNAAETPEERADLALRELIRVGAFERAVLVIAVPTGTGWMDPAAFDTLDYLTAGDVATVAVQYSYLTSWISLLVEPGYGEETGRALFRAVYRYWTDLPHDARPKLYLQGLSLGSISSEQSVSIHEMLADPVQGAVWSGPPFPSPTWRAITDNREPGSPAWLPVFEDSSLVRFTNQENALDIPGARWGPLRVVYLQYASDPIVFFEPDSFWREPAWMKAPRGPDVSPALRWVPVVTFLQLLLDMALGLAVPMGHGHLYHFSHYIDAWRAVIDPPGWDTERTESLKAFFAPRAATAEGE
ncbi:MAG: hypothetical protein DI556_02450 [Rhodovulum sulfidophilum]|uniref:Alpha/beta-hydrolase family protein n=1 Tax=Rhodovulum sulfidophilum TaxID=35806 RepID=A0A2W5NJU6_RHOSU|nr:MAG: hypothetical protein DI556_02450 [Rhodovulum sulfidophilum]